MTGKEDVLGIWDRGGRGEKRGGRVGGVGKIKKGKKSREGRKKQRHCIRQYKSPKVSGG